jgi:hypothetical protein
VKTKVEKEKVGQHKRDNAATTVGPEIRGVVDNGDLGLLDDEAPMPRGRIEESLAWLDGVLRAVGHPFHDEEAANFNVSISPDTPEIPDWDQRREMRALEDRLFIHAGLHGERGQPTIWTSCSSTHSAPLDHWRMASWNQEVPTTCRSALSAERLPE